MGNRGGVLHRSDKTLGRRRWVSRRWICCRLEFKGWHRQVMSPGRYTELFFLDEAVAMAAGHRPCAECRRHDYLTFMEIWGRCHELPSRGYADDVDRQLHGERLNSAGGQRTYLAPIDGLPDGTFIDWQDRPALIDGKRLLPWLEAAYGEAMVRPQSGTVRVLTPKSLVRVLRHGYPVQYAGTDNSIDKGGV